MLIAPSNELAIWALLFAAVALSFRLEKTTFGAKLSGVMIAMLIGFLLTNCNILPPDNPVFDLIWGKLVILSIPLFLLRANLLRIFHDVGPTMIAFIAGAVGTIIGGVSGFLLIPLGEEASKLAGMFIATYIGGSINFLAVAKATAMDNANLMAAGTAADNLVTGIYFFTLFALWNWPWLRRQFHPPESNPNPSTAVIKPSTQPSMPSVLILALALAFSFGLFAISQKLTLLIGNKTWLVLFVTVFSLLLACTLPQWMAKMEGVEQIGILLMQIFFVVIGASANIGLVVKIGPMLFVFALWTVLIHGLCILSIGKLLRLDLRQVLIASNANVGGPTTASAMAVSQHWNDLVTPAILVGTFGYAIATFIGIIVHQLLR